MIIGLGETLVEFLEVPRAVWYFRVKASLLWHLWISGQENLKSIFRWFYWFRNVEFSRISYLNLCWIPNKFLRSIWCLVVECYVVGLQLSVPNSSCVVKMVIALAKSNVWGPPHSRRFDRNCEGSEYWPPRSLRVGDFTLPDRGRRVREGLWRVDLRVHGE